MMEMVVQGVSTRNVKKVTEELCGESFSKSTVSEICKELDVPIKHFKERLLPEHYPFIIVDATYLKAREDHRVKSKALFVAIGVKHDGLVHISEMSEKFIKNPSEVVSVGDVVKVKVIKIDKERQKVGLSMKI